MAGRRAGAADWDNRPSEIRCRHSLRVAEAEGSDLEELRVRVLSDVWDAVGLSTSAYILSFGEGHSYTWSLVFFTLRPEEG